MNRRGLSGLKNQMALCLYSISGSRFAGSGCVHVSREVPRYGDYKNELILFFMRCVPELSMHLHSVFRATATQATIVTAYCRFFRPGCGATKVAYSIRYRVLNERPGAEVPKDRPILSQGFCRRVKAYANPKHCSSCLVVEFGWRGFYFFTMTEPGDLRARINGIRRTLCASCLPVRLCLSLR
jgi:hypothetical protein